MEPCGGSLRAWPFRAPVPCALDGSTVWEEEGGFESRLNGPTVIRFTMDSLIAANTKFCFDLFQKISKDDYHKNIFFCPLSISAALGMVRLGARSDSARQIDQVLHFNEFSQNETKEPDPCLKSKKREGHVDNSLEGQKKETTGSLTLEAESSNDESGLLSCYFGQLLSRLDRIRVDYTLSIANRLYGEQEFPICPFSSLRCLQGPLGKIKELFSKDTLNNATVLVLVNAVYFKAKWDKYFDCENTVDALFSLNENEKKSVKMMNQKGLFRIGFVEELKAQILELRYTKGKLSMLVLLPSPSEDNLKGLEELERNITYEKIMAWSSSENMSEETVAVSFPQFTLEDSYDLNPVLQDMGITDVFDEMKADLTGISPSPSLYLSKVVHKTFVEVDEDGTQAVAASGVVGMEKSLVSWETFNADRPFLFFIRHNKTQTILFYGRVCSP
ncbi:serine or cysteine proteinase inhibitor, clade B, member 5-like protein [Camelus ferus]|nr:serine or cysteine proteinase inhibitor, clade B, member 5-like protein [Camelus ferus]